MLTANFSRDELKCKCGCDKCNMSLPFLLALQTVRDIVGRPLGVSSGYRCAEHNKAIGGAEHSYHMVGRAADVITLTPEETAEILSAAKKAGLVAVEGKGFVHLDNGPLRKWSY